MAFVTFCPTPAYATCDINAPASGNTVTCVAAGGTDTTGVVNSGANNVTIDVQNGAAIGTTGSLAVDLGSGTTLDMAAGSTVTATGSDAIHIDSGTINLTGAGAALSAQTGGTNAITTTNGLTLNIASGTAAVANTNAAQKVVYFSGGGASAVNINVSGDLTGHASGIAVDFGLADATFTLYDTGTVTGLVTAKVGGSDSFVLDGTGSNSFNASDIGVGQKYDGFDDYTKNGSGTWILTGTGTQNWSVGAGTLQGTTTSLQGNVANNGNVTLSQAGAGTYAGDMSGGGTLTKAGAGTITLSGTNTYSGGTNLNAGGLTGTTTSLQGDISSGVGTAVTFDQAGNGSYTGALTGSASLTKLGAGNVTLSGANTYSGGTTITAGTLTGTTSSLQGNITNNATLGFNQAGNGSFTDVISGTGNVVKSGAGNVTLSNVNTYLGGTTVSGGTITINAESGLGNVAGALTLDNGTLQYGAAFSTARATTVAAAGGTINTNGNAITMSGVVSGAGNLTKTGAGNLSLTNTNTYLGSTQVSAGNIVITNDNNLGDSSSSVTLDGGGLLLNGFDVTSTRSMSLGAGNGTFNTNGQNLTINGNITGAGGFTKAGVGKLTLGGTNSYSGDITLSAGTLEGTSASIKGNVANSGILSFAQAGGGTYIGNVTGTGSLEKSGAGNLILSGTNSYSGGTTVSAGTLTVTTNSLPGDAVNDGAVIFSQAFSGTYAGTMSGIGSLTKLGAGEVTLSGPNTYAGGTTISGGILTGTTTSLQGNIVNNATLKFSQAGNGTFADTIGGSGSVVKQGAGTVTLSNTNTYTGGTTVTAGAVNFSDDANLGNSSGSLTLNGGTAITGAALTSTRNVTLGAGNGTIDTNGFSSSFTGVVSGAGSLTKTGAGTLTLTNTNTYLGGTTVSAGTLSGNANALQGDITNNATVNFNQTTDDDYAGNMSGTGVLTKTGAGNLTITGTNSYSGGTTITAGTLTGTTSSLQGDITDNAALAFSQAGNGTYAGTISGTGSLTKLGAGNVTLTGPNTYSGGTTVSAGTLTGTTTSLQGDITNNATLSFDDAAGGAFNSIISGSGAVTKLGAGTVALNGVNSYAGGTTVTAGTIQVGAQSGLGAVGGTLTLDGGTLQYSAGFSSARNVALGAGNGTVDTNGNAATISGTISGAGGFTKAGAGNLTVTGPNSYTGGTTVTAGTLTGTTTSLQGDITDNAEVAFDQAGNGTYTGNISGTGALTKLGAGNVTISGTNSYSGGTTVTAGTLTGTTGSLQGDITNNATVTFSQAGNGTYAGVMSGAGAVNKTGAGTVTLTNTNTYTGGTFITGGAINVSADANLGDTTSAVTLDSGTMILGGAFTSTHDMTLGAGNGTVNTNGNDGTISGDITGAGAFTKTGVGILTLSGTNTYSGGTTVSTGTLRGTTDSLQGNILDNTIVNFEQAGNGTYAGTLSGVGSLLKTGIGNVTLTGPNTYSGGTTVTAGTLTGTTTSLQGDITDNALVAFDQAGSGTYAGTISGTGALEKLGTGDVTLTGPNTYSGGTTVTAGTLTGSTTSIQGNVTNNATVTLNQAVNGTYAGNMSGTGALNKLGAGNVTLGGTNTYSGGTTVGGGTLTGTTSSLQGAITNNSAVVFDQGGAGSYTGNMSGTGTLTKLGAGNVTLSGINSYSGGTTVTAGTLTGNTTSIQGAVTNNAAVVFDQAGAGTYAGTMSGTGSLTKINGGVVTLTGPNTYSGGTTVTAGGITGTTTSLQGNVVNNAAVTFDQGTDGTYAGTMSGTGTLTKLSAGNVTLTGPNTYSGGTTVGAGTLTGTTTSLQGNIVDNAAIVFDQAGSGTHSGIISGTGTLTKLGTGNVTIVGLNTYAGGTTVTAGTLTGTTSSLQGAITNNAAVVFDQAGSGSYTGIMGGTGSLTKLGTGDVTLSGANTYSGGTTITAGTLIGSTTSLQGNIVDNAALIINQAGAGTYGGNVSGTGTLTKQGAGNVILSGASSYTGGTFITGGAITASADNNLGAVAGDLTLDSGMYMYGAGFTSAREITLGAGNGTINTNGFSSQLTGIISGAGSLTKTGAGNLTLAGTNTYSGGTTITTGTLTGTTTSLQGAITNNAALVFDQTVAGTYGNAISGTGTLTKLGTGNTILSGVNTYSGATTVTAGRLSVNGSNTNSTTTIGVGGTLGGTGTTGTVIANGRLAPGNSIGTLNVNGPLTFNIGSTYEVEINAAGANDLTIATGAITINGGTIDVRGAAGVYADATDYTILQGASVTGLFDTVTSDLAFLDPTLTYHAADVVLTMTRNDTDFAETAGDPVQADVANSLEALGSGNTLYDLFTGYTVAESQQTLEMLSGESTAGTAGYLASTSVGIRNIIAGRMMTLNNGSGIAGNETNYTPEPDIQVSDASDKSPADIEPAAGGYEEYPMEQVALPKRLVNRTQMWGEAIGGIGQSKAQGTAPQQDRGSAGVIFGMDRLMDDNGYFGAYAGFERGEVDTSSQNSKSDIDSYHIGVYRTKPMPKGDWRLSGGIGASVHTVDTTRYVLIPGFSATAEGSTTGETLTAFVEAAKTYKTPKNFRVEPYVNLGVTGSRTEGFTEKGGGAANLKVGDSTAADVSHTIGLRVGKTMVGPNDFRLAIRGSAGWQHTYGDLDSGTTMRFANGGTRPFTVYGPRRVADAAIVSLSADSLINNNATAYAHYDGVLGMEDQDHKFTVGLKIPFPFNKKDKEDMRAAKAAPKNLAEIPELAGTAHNDAPVMTVEPLQEITPKLTVEAVEPGQQQPMPVAVTESPKIELRMAGTTIVAPKSGNTTRLTLKNGAADAPAPVSAETNAAHEGFQLVKK